MPTLGRERFLYDVHADGTFKVVAFNLLCITEPANGPAVAGWFEWVYLCHFLSNRFVAGQAHKLKRMGECLQKIWVWAKNFLAGEKPILPL